MLSQIKTSLRDKKKALEKTFISETVDIWKYHKQQRPKLQDARDDKGQAP